MRRRGEKCWRDSPFLPMVVEVVRHSGMVATDHEKPDLTHLTRPGKRGRVKISHLFLLLCLVVVGILGTQAVSGYVTYLSVRETVRTVIRNVAVSPQKADENNAHLVATVRDLGVPIREDEMFIAVYEAKVQVTIIWQHPIGLGRFTLPLTFEVDESQALR